jgi:hypothetical protein
MFTIYLYYIDTFDLSKDENVNDVRAITMQREQYDVTVHLFIGTGRSTDKITFMSLTFTVNHKASYQVLSSLFPFRSVSSSTFDIILRRSSFSHSFGVRSSCLRVVSPYHAYLHLKAEASCNSLCYTEKHVNHVFEDLWKRKAPNTCMTTSVVPILMMSFFVVLLVVVGICPYRTGRPLRPSGPAILLGLCLVTGLSGAQSVLYWRCEPIEYRCLGCPPSGVMWHP